METNRAIKLEQKANSLLEEIDGLQDHIADLRVEITANRRTNDQEVLEIRRSVNRIFNLAANNEVRTEILCSGAARRAQADLRPFQNSIVALGTAADVTRAFDSLSQYLLNRQSVDESNRCISSVAKKDYYVVEAKAAPVAEAKATAAAKQKEKDAQTKKSKKSKTESGVSLKDDVNSMLEKLAAQKQANRNKGGTKAAPEAKTKPSSSLRERLAKIKKHRKKQKTGTS